MRPILVPNANCLPDPSKLIPPLLAALDSAQIRVIKETNIGIAADAILPELSERTPGAPQIAKVPSTTDYSLVITTDKDFCIAPVFAADVSTGELYVLQLNVDSTPPALVWEKTSVSTPEEYIAAYNEEHSAPPSTIIFDHQLQPCVVWR